MKKITKKQQELIGMRHQFKGVFKLYQTANIFQFIEQTPSDMLKDINDGSVVTKYGRIQPRVKIKSEGMIVGILNKKEGLFVCNKYPSSVFQFPLSNMKGIYA